MSASVIQATTGRHRRRIDGSSWIWIRPIERTDAAALADFYAGLAVESRRRRFMSPAVPPEAVIQRLADAPGIVAEIRQIGPSDGAIVGHASVQPDGRAAEVAFAVADEYQRRGLGRLLVGAAMRLARRLGADHASATMLADNIAMRRLLLGAGLPVGQDALEAGTEDIVLDLAPVRRAALV